VNRVFATTTRTLLLGALAIAPTAGCDTNLPIDSYPDNPFVPPPIGIIQGTASYYGPAPCVKDGHVEGALVVLLFDYNNPPPPDGLATTALNLATVPGDKLFTNAVIPTSGPGSKGNASSKCAAKGDPTITATADWTLAEVLAGRYQIRAFYSQHNDFHPLFDSKNLPVAGDIGGAALSDPASGKIMQVTVGVPTTDTKNHPNGLLIPDTGFLAANVPILVGQPFLSSRPYFWIDPQGSRGFVNEKAPKQGETPRKDAMGKDVLAVDYPQADPAEGDNFSPTFPQDLNITGQQNLSCAGNPDPACDIFKYAQGSLPQLHFRYGFPTAGTQLGKKVGGMAAGDDLGIARLAKLQNPLNGGSAPFYGLEPFPLEPPKTDVATTQNDPSQRFNLTRVYSPDPFTGAIVPAILHDNDALETLAYIAEVYPLVVLAKMQEGANGLPVDPPTPQIDPVVVIQAITLRNDKLGNGTMKATSESPITCGGLTHQVPDPDPANPGGKICVPDTSMALESKSGVELQDNFTALIRPATLCVRPDAANANPKGVLVAPFAKDFNPVSIGGENVGKDHLMKAQAAKLSDIQFGCLPPGYYSVNIVYPAGQAWGIPNNTGYCTSGLAKLVNGQWNDGELFEDCAFGSPKGTAANPLVYPAKPGRPLLVSQQVFLDGGPHATAANPNKFNTMPLIVKIEPSLRCMHKIPEPAGVDLNHNGVLGEPSVWVNNAANEDKNANGILDTGEDTGGPSGTTGGPNQMLDMNIPAACLPKCRRGADGKVDVSEASSTSCTP
jgi:hypothetical protein